MCHGIIAYLLEEIQLNKPIKVAGIVILLIHPELYFIEGRLIQ